MHITRISTHGDHTFTLTTPGSYTYFVNNVNGSLSIDIQAEDIHVSILGLYTGKQDQAYSLKTIQKHSCGSSESDVLIKGVFHDASQFQYEGLIRIEPGAHESAAYQKNQNLILGDEVHVDSRPFLEICADNVKCTHGSTTSGIAQDQLIYCGMRGIQPADAENVIVDGFMDEVMQRLEAAEAQASIHSSLA